MAKRRGVRAEELPEGHSVRVLYETLRSVAKAEVQDTNASIPTGTERMRAAVALIMLEYHLADGKLSGKEIGAIYRTVNGDVSKNKKGFWSWVGDMLEKIID